MSLGRYYANTVIDWIINPFALAPAIGIQSVNISENPLVLFGTHIKI